MDSVARMPPSEHSSRQVAAGGWPSLPRVAALAHHAHPLLPTFHVPAAELHHLDESAISLSSRLAYWRSTSKGGAFLEATNLYASTLSCGIYVAYCYITEHVDAMPH